MLALGVVLQNCNPESERESLAQTTSNYVGDASCASCHSKEHSEWRSSHHFMAMLPANDTTVAGDFNDATLTADGITSRFFRRDGKFFINTQGEDGQNRDYEVKYTFGFTPLQQYLVEFPGGRMQVPRVSWDVKQKKWYHQYAGQDIPAHDWLHWTGNAQNWNTMCASCHSTNLVKGYDWQNDAYHTTYNSINVSCESCHGPGSGHIAYINGEDYKKGVKTAGALLASAKNQPQNEQLNTCGLCHARKTDITGAVMPGHEFLDDFIPQTPATEWFHADGQMDEEVYTYSSFLQSKMFRRGVKCGDCHNPHSGKLVLNGNLMCNKCHESSKYDTPVHHFHMENTASAECKSCHMYAKEYMGNDLRHDHSFRVPRPDLSAKYGTPNTCNSCHNDKSAKWAANAIVKWYGPVRQYHFAEDLVPGSRMDDKSFAHLQKLLNDTAVPGIIQAVSAEYLGGIRTQQSLTALLECLSSRDAHVRYRALRSLSDFDPVSWIAQVTPLLSDPVRAVRIAAADLFSGLPAHMVPPNSRNALAGSKKELEQYLFYQTDFAVGNSMAGDYFTKTQDYVSAEKYYRRALKMDSVMNYARLNLSAVLSSQGKNQEALKALDDAVVVDQNNDRVWYNKALLLAEMNDLPGAMECFEKAIALNTSNPRVYYNYGLLLQQSGNESQAEKTFLKGIARDPLNGDLNYALAVLYLNTSRLMLARQPLNVLREYYPENPLYRELLQKMH
jgi:tetratricopeptide (TPR) repeat protein